MLGYLSADKYLSIFSRQMEAIVFIILQIFYATRAVLKIGEYPRIFPSFTWGIFAHVTRLDQSRKSENIWWIIISYISLIPSDCRSCLLLPFSHHLVLLLKLWSDNINWNRCTHITRGQYLRSITLHNCLQKSILRSNGVRSIWSFSCNLK